jgi:murein DD-endopeptidase MepM/ murein hydrolase activator NlpD
VLHHALALPLALLLAGPGMAGPGAPDPPVPAVTVALPPGTWSWPVHGPILRGFDPPESPFGAGHRGIDIAAPIGTVVHAPEGAVVSFAGKVGGHLFVTLGPAASSRARTLARLHAGPQGRRARSRSGLRPRSPGPVVHHLHLGVRLAGAYVDPLLYLEPWGPGSRLAPLVGSEVVAPAA